MLFKNVKTVYAHHSHLQTPDLDLLERLTLSTNQKEVYHPALRGKCLSCNTMVSYKYIPRSSKMSTERTATQNHSLMLQTFIRYIKRNHENINLKCDTTNSACEVNIRTSSSLLPASFPSCTRRNPFASSPTSQKEGTNIYEKARSSS